MSAQSARVVACGTRQQQAVVDVVDAATLDRPDVGRFQHWLEQRTGDRAVALVVDQNECLNTGWPTTWDRQSGTSEDWSCDFRAVGRRPHQAGRSVVLTRRSMAPRGALSVRCDRALMKPDHRLPVTVTSACTLAFRHWLPVMFDDSEPRVSTHLVGVAALRARPRSPSLLLRHTPLADRGGLSGSALRTTAPDPGSGVACAP